MLKMANHDNFHDGVSKIYARLRS